LFQPSWFIQLFVYTSYRNITIFDFHLVTVKDWAALVPPTAIAAGFVYVSYLAFCPVAQCPGRARQTKRVNQKVRMSEAKVVDMVDVEDIAEKAAFCRCWKTKNWPYW
jgi:CDGSH iron-sulfur domain-containing protein 2